MHMGSSRIITSLYHWLLKIIKNVFSLTGITCICLFTFATAITWFYYTLASKQMNMWECIYFKDKWRNAILGLGTLAVFVFDFIGVNHFIHKQIIICFKVVIIIVYLLVIGVYFGIITDPYVYFLSLNIGTFIVTLLILISGSRHDLLSD